MKNRIFKFRIWNKENDCWADVRHSLIEQVCLTRMDGYFSFEDIFQADYVDTPLIFQQFTGLKDCKGKEIYEGDILKLNEKEWNFQGNGIVEKSGIGEVKFGFWEDIDIDGNEIEHYGHFVTLKFYYKREDNSIYDMTESFPIHICKNCEIIGNIFETPELLK